MSLDCDICAACHSIFFRGEGRFFGHGVHPWQQTWSSCIWTTGSERQFVAGCVHTELTVVRWLTDNGHVFSVIAVVNAPASMSTLTQRRLVALTLDVVKPRLSRPTAVVVTEIQAWSPVPTLCPIHHHCCSLVTRGVKVSPASCSVMNLTMLVSISVLLSYGLINIHACNVTVISLYVRPIY